MPTGAKVFVNDRATTTAGADRQFVSHGLEQGKVYTYRVRVEYQLNGEMVVKNKVANLTMGNDISLNFGNTLVASDGEEEEEEEGSSTRVADSNQDDDEDEDEDGSATKLTLHVPADARVTLAGSVTKQTGSERSFLSTHLASGQTWENYTVEVAVDRNGQTQTQQQLITLRGGESHELAFDFDELSLTGPKLAAAN